MRPLSACLLIEIWPWPSVVRTNGRSWIRRCLWPSTIACWVIKIGHFSLNLSLSIPKGCVLGIGPAVIVIATVDIINGIMSSMSTVSMFWSELLGSVTGPTGLLLTEASLWRRKVLIARDIAWTIRSVVTCSLSVVPHLSLLRMLRSF